MYFQAIQTYGALRLGLDFHGSRTLLYIIDINSLILLLLIFSYKDFRNKITNPTTAF